MGSVPGKCKKDSDCYANASSPTNAEQTKMCCAYMEIEKIDTTKSGHTLLIALMAADNMPTTEGAKAYYCEDDYPTAFGPAFMDKDNHTTIDTSIWNKAGIEFKAYCDGHANNLIAGAITSLATIVMM